MDISITFKDIYQKHFIFVVKNKSKRLKQFYLFIILLLGCILHSVAQHADTSKTSSDTTATKPFITALTPLQKILNDNIYLNTRTTSVSLAERPKNTTNENAVFYILAGLVFLFGIIKTIYARYFSTLFRVFFNSSLRQSQLTDQLIQAKLPSLFFNTVFVLAGGLYVYFLMQRVVTNNKLIDWMLMAGCVLAFIIIYLIKFFSVKFIGWVTGYNSEADTYIFIVFLISKIIGICLLPIIVVLAFSNIAIMNVVVILSFILVGVMLLFRFIRSFSLLQHKLKISRFHFLLYIFSLEILPLLLIYKAVELLINKKL